MITLSVIGTSGQYVCHLPSDETEMLRGRKTAGTLDISVLTIQQPVPVVTGLRLLVFNFLEKKQVLTVH